jgi:lipopolysaccharide/colanic/teichoic acid biosynthesis glycosyltransferase
MASQAFKAPETIASTWSGSRLLDIAMAAAGLVLLLPLLTLISIVILLESGGPVLFAQKRLTLNGRIFVMYKFRKFRADCGTSGSPLTVAGDARMTPFGRVLCASKLDELPQLWNVLIGDMAIVGPRPESLEFADCFRDGYEKVLLFRPGLLGPAQVMFRDEAKFLPTDGTASEVYRSEIFPLKADLDLRYYMQRSLAGDIGWIALGSLAVLGWRVGAHGLQPRTCSPQIVTSLPSKILTMPAKTAGSTGKGRLL